MPTASSGPPSTTRSGAPSSEAAAAVGGGGRRLAVPVGARDRDGSGALRDGVDEIVVGHPRPMVCSGSPRWSVRPARRGSDQRERAGPEPVGHLGHPRHRPAERERLLGGRAQDRDRHVGVPSLQREHPVDRRAPTSAARPARRRCRSAARQHHRAEHHHDLVDLCGVGCHRWRRYRAPTAAACGRTRYRNPYLRPTATCARSAGSRTEAVRRWVSALSDEGTVAAGEVGLDPARPTKPAARASAAPRPALGLADLDDEGPAGVSQSRALRRRSPRWPRARWARPPGRRRGSQSATSAGSGSPAAT